MNTTINATADYQQIAAFVAKQTVANICSTNAAGEPYCFSCYYAFQKESALLFFKTDDASHHMQLLLQRPQLAGTIVPDKLNKLSVQGIQLKGELLPYSEGESLGAATAYHKAYPFALAMPGKVYVIRLQWMKMTDSTLGFGKKVVWEG
jgi:uncharacterized protein YhbP (UPF0306 family)